MFTGRFLCWLRLNGAAELLQPLQAILFAKLRAPFGRCHIARIIVCGVDDLGEHIVAQYLAALE